MLSIEFCTSFVNLPVVWSFRDSNCDVVPTFATRGHCHCPSRAYFFSIHRVMLEIYVWVATFIQYRLIFFII